MEADWFDRCIATGFKKKGKPKVKIKTNSMKEGREFKSKRKKIEPEEEKLEENSPWMYGDDGGILKIEDGRENVGQCKQESRDNRATKLCEQSLWKSMYKLYNKTYLIELVPTTDTKSTPKNVAPGRKSFSHITHDTKKKVQT